MATRFDDTTADHKWSTAGNWSDGIPDSADAVTIGAAVSSLIIDAPAVCLSIDMSGAAADFVLSGSSTLSVHGDVVFKASSVTTQSYSGTMALDFNDLSFTSNGMTLAASLTMYANTNGKIMSLGDDLTTTGAISIRGSELVTNNHDISCSIFGDSGVGTAKTLTLGTSTITCTNVAFTGTAPTVTSTDHTIELNEPNAGSSNYFGGGVAWGILNWHVHADNAARTHNISNANGSFKKINILHDVDQRGTVFGIANNITINESSSWAGGGVAQDNPTIRPLIKSTTTGTTRNITMAAGTTLTITDCDLQDIKVVADTACTLTRVGDCGGNTKTTGGGYVQNVSDPKTVYAACGAASIGYASDIWTTESSTNETTRNAAAKSLNNYPLPQDTAIIDDASWTSTGKNFTFSAGLRFGNIDASGLTESQNAVLQGGSCVYYGDLFLPANFVAAGSSITITFDARTSIVSYVSIASLDETAITIDSYGGTVQLASALTHTGTFTLTRGAFDLTGNTLTTNKLSSSGSAARELQWHGGNIIVKQTTGDAVDFTTDTNLTIHDAGAIQLGDSTLTLAADVHCHFGDTGTKIFGDLTFKKYAGAYSYVIYGTGITFGAVSNEVPSAAVQSYKFQNGKTFTASGWTWAGTSSYEITVTSDDGANTFTLSDSTGNNTATETTIDYCVVGGGATWTASDGTCHDGGHNGSPTWVFIAASGFYARHYYDMAQSGGLNV